MIFTGLVEGFAGAIVWQALIGVGSGASNVPVMALMAAWFARRRRGFAAGLAVGGSSVAMILTGPLVPRLLDAYSPDGWRLAWFLFGGATIAIALASWLLLRNHPAEKGLLPIASEGEEADGKGEQRRTGPLPWRSVYRSATVWHLGLVYVAFGFSYIIYITFFSKRLISEGGYSAQQAGTLFMLVGWASLLCGVIWGALSDLIGRKRALIIVYGVQAVAYALFALWPVPAGFTLSALLFGLTAWSIPAIMAATCGDVLGPRMAPAALGFVTLFFGVGQAVGPSVAGAMADASGSFVSAYLLAAAIALVGAFVASLLRPAATVYDGAVQ
jgi:MFS family permease